MDSEESRFSAEGDIFMPPEVPQFVELTQEQADRMGLVEGEMVYVPLAGHEPTLWKVKELATALGVKRQTIYGWIMADKVKALKTPGGHLRIPTAEVIRLLSEGVGETSESPLT